MKKSIIDIEFSPIFESRFKESKEMLEIREKFVRNIINECVEHNIDIPEKVKKINENTSWGIFINDGFIWEKTPEKGIFWSYVAERY